MKFKIDHDLHIHSSLSSCSPDAEQTPINILKYAKEMGFSKICITDHFWDNKVDGASPWYKPQDFEHISKALPLPTDESVKFYFGCETEMDKNLNLAIDDDKYSKLDFIIVPTSHLHNPGYTIDESIVTAKQRAEFYMSRNHALCDMKLPFHKVGLAHFTSALITWGGEGSVDDALDYITDSEYHELFSRVAKLGMGVELNTSVAEAKKESVLRPYRIARKCGCKFYLGSDAHSRKGFVDVRERFSAIVDALDLTEDDKFTFAKS